jgi:hypothetical protein
MGGPFWGARTMPRSHHRSQDLSYRRVFGLENDFLLQEAVYGQSPPEGDVEPSEPRPERVTATGGLTHARPLGAPTRRRV